MAIPIIIDHAGLYYVTANNARRWQLPKSKIAAIKPEVEITLSGERWHRDSNFHSHIFGHEYDTVDTAPRRRHLKFKMGATETGNGNGMSLRPNCNGYCDICDTGLVCDSADIALRSTFAS